MAEFRFVRRWRSKRLVSAAACALLSASVAADFGRDPTNNGWPPLDQATQSELNLLQSNYYVVFDGSGSMRSWKCTGAEKLAVAQRAVKRFVSNLPANANLGFLAFDRSGTRERVALGPDNRAAVRESIDGIRAYGETPLAEALSVGYQALTQQAARQLGYGEYHLVVVTDGRASKGQSPKRLVSQMLGESPIVLHTIGLCVAGGHSLNQPGSSYYTRAEDRKSLDRALDQVLAEETAFQIRNFKQGGS